MDKQYDVLCCINCNAKVSQDVSYKINKKGILLVSDVLDTVQVIQDGSNENMKHLVCSCGNAIGQIHLIRRGWRYCLDTKLIKRCTVSSDQGNAVAGDMTSSSADKCNVSSSTDTSSNKELAEMKKKMEELQAQMQSMETGYSQKLRDISKIMFSYKLEILRLQEVIWALHPDVNLNPAFCVDNNTVQLMLQDVCKDRTDSDSGFGSST